MVNRSAFRSFAPKSEGHTALAVSILLLAAGAWLALWFLDNPSQLVSHGQHLHHHGGTGAISAVGLLLFVLGWTLMTVAMMLPTSLSVLTVFNKIAESRSDRWLLVALVIVGYLLVWGIFGVIVYLGNVVLQGFASISALPTQYSWIVAPILLCVAGIFQFTSLKYSCLDKCRSPLSFVIGHWQGRRNRWQSFRLGTDHGIFCVGCCWALMLLMFIVSVGSLVWMMILAVVMGIEKNAPWGRKLTAPLGVALLTSAVAYVIFT